MIYSLNGTLTHIDSNFVVIECNGIGFKCIASANTISLLGDIGDKVSLFTYMDVKDDSVELFGFIDTAEQDCYLKLVSVSGIGSKYAMSILSVLSPSELAKAVTSENVKAISAAPGVGVKSAQRIILELKSKFSDLQYSVSVNSAEKSVIPESRNISEAIIALEALGYVHGQAAASTDGIDPALPVNQIIKLALKNLM